MAWPPVVVVVMTADEDGAAAVVDDDNPPNIVTWVLDLSRGVDLRQKSDFHRYFTSIFIRINSSRIG